MFGPLPNFCSGLAFFVKLSLSGWRKVLRLSLWLSRLAGLIAKSLGSLALFGVLLSFVFWERSVFARAFILQTLEF